MTTRLILVLLMTGMASLSQETAPCAPSRADNAVMTEALRIATSRQPDAKSRLEAIRRATKSQRVTQFLSWILRSWDDRDNTYHLKHPGSSDSSCFCGKPPNSERVRKGTPILVRVEVNAEGFVTTASLLKAGDNADLAPAMIENVKQKRFVPATGESGPIASTLDLLCRIEVR